MRRYSPNTTYTLTGQSSLEPIPLADLNGTQLTVRDEFFPATNIEDGTFTEYIALRNQGESF